MLRFPTVSPEPVHQPVSVGAAPLKGQHSLATNVVGRVYGRMPAGGYEHQLLVKGLHPVKAIIVRRIDHEYRVQPIFQHIHIQ